MKRSLGVLLAVGIWLIVVANFFVNLYDLDSPAVGIDDLLHFAGGLWLAGVLIYLNHRLPKLKIENWKLIIAIVLLVGITWEVGEFLIDYYIENKTETMHDGLLDTGLDLFFDLAGASIFLLLWRKRERHLSLKAVKS